MATWLAVACSIDDRTVDLDCLDPEGCIAADGGGAGGKGSGGKAGSGGAANTGGKGSGGAQSTGGRGSGGKAGSGGTAPGTGGGGGGPSATIDDAVLRMASSYCRLANGCAPFFIAVSYGDVDECIDRTVLMNSWLAGVPGSHHDITHYDACAAAYEEANAGDDCAVFYAPAPPDACVSRGDYGVGEPCHAFNQCESLYCATEGYNCGTCAAEPAPGAACTFNADCALGESCQRNGRCAVPRQRGADCDDTSAACALPMSCYQGKCVDSPLQVGAACHPANGLFCDRTYGVTCDGTKCVAIPPIDVGESCTAQYAFCVDMGVCSAGTCVEGPADGAACDPEAGRECRWPAICYGGRCMLPGEGTSCDGPAPPGN